MPGIEFSDWNTQVGFNPENIPAFVIESITRNWENESSQRVSPVYVRDSFYNCDIIYDINTNSAVFDDLNERVIQEIRLMIEGGFLTLNNYKVDNFEIFRGEIDGLDIRGYNFQIITTNIKDFVEC